MLIGFIGVSRYLKAVFYLITRVTKVSKAEQLAVTILQ